MSFVQWLIQNAVSALGISLLLFIPYWLIISNLWQVISGDHISLQTFVIIQVLNLLALITTQYVLYRKFGREKKYSMGTILVRIFTPLPAWLHQRRQSRKSVEMPRERTITVPNVGEVHLCCYNAARLKDTYCMCGRAIPPKLIAYFES